MGLQNEIGSFCWWSLMTPDPQAATSFYQGLFGWESSKMDFPGEGPVTIFRGPKGGFANPVPLSRSDGIPPHWISYIAVEDVDKSCDRVKNMGGQVAVSAFDLPNVGRTAVLKDPAGAPFHVFTPFDPKSEVNRINNGAGQICWVELMVDDPKPLIPFYSELFGWKMAEPVSINGWEYTSIEINGEKVGGFMKRPPEVSPMPAMWMNYMRVENVDEASKKAQDLGAKIFLPKMQIPDTGWFAGVEDPTGGHFYLFEFLGGASS